MTKIVTRSQISGVRNEHFYASGKPILNVCFLQEDAQKCIPGGG